ncbi:hypothetical protein M427DRAFT_319193 [Gonapodya prolifera JEL478]|uniref:RING-type domain-containing protein n=1 Tax=Gonapodya prolifera (strain JEL478) TaxID=1344416 RepID=A0A139AXE8_GONPJ|nr:hypothetical protein M427DRAFT_319193 [Gonapodya prolifera JEL478]|eukprot:KXS21422.1 hypothetical protein M427DRAFT_319193 [Gonapodya prolifera JEL478]
MNGRKSGSVRDFSSSNEFHVSQKHLNSFQVLQMAGSSADARSNGDRSPQTKSADPGATIECECCCGDSPLANAAWCEGGHSFCDECVKRSAGERISLQQPRIQCLAMGGDCKEVISHQELRRVLGEKMWESYERLCQKKEIENAFEDMQETLEKCPICTEYAELVSAPPEVVKLFHCKNTNCMAVTCRLCQKVNHLPQTCEEARKDVVLDVQHRVEEVATEALLRSCPKCKNGRKFMKEDGCNKMTCPDCGSLICYVCRKLIPESYKHFNQQPGQQINPNDKQAAQKCPLWDDTNHRHAKEVTDAIKRERNILRDAALADGVDVDKVKVDVPVVPKQLPHRNAVIGRQPQPQPPPVNRLFGGFGGLNRIAPLFGQLQQVGVQGYEPAMVFGLQPPVQAPFAFRAPPVAPVAPPAPPPPARAPEPAGPPQPRRGARRAVRFRQEEDGFEGPARDVKRRRR